jgi:hypothetical protein
LSRLRPSPHSSTVAGRAQWLRSAQHGQGAFVYEREKISQFFTLEWRPQVCHVGGAAAKLNPIIKEIGAICGKESFK